MSPVILKIKCLMHTTCTLQLVIYINLTFIFKCIWFGNPKNSFFYQKSTQIVSQNKLNACLMDNVILMDKQRTQGV